MRPSLLLAVFGICCYAPAALLVGAQDAKLLSTLDAKNKQIDDAIIKGDLTPVLDLLSPSMTITNPVGAFISREELSRSLMSGALRYTSIKLSEEKLAQYGDVAVFTFLSNEAGTMQGHDISGKYRYIGVWARQSGHWTLVAVQLTPVVPGP